MYCVVLCISLCTRRRRGGFKTPHITASPPAPPPALRFSPVQQPREHAHRRLASPFRGPAALLGAAGCRSSDPALALTLTLAGGGRRVSGLSERKKSDPQARHAMGRERKEKATGWWGRPRLVGVRPHSSTEAEAYIPCARPRTGLFSVNSTANIWTGA